MLIKNATIVDGTGAKAFEADIRVVGERITEIGDALEPAENDQLIDATGLVVAPGFIDMHAHVSNIHDYPQAENFLRQGVTTIANSLHSHDLPWPLDEYTAKLKMAPNICQQILRGRTDSAPGAPVHGESGLSACNSSLRHVTQAADASL